MKKEIKKMLKKRLWGFDSKKELNIDNVEIYTNLENELSIRYQKDKTTYVITSVAVQNEE